VKKLKKSKKTLSRKVSKVKSKYTDLTELNDPQFITIFGNSGTGKSTFAASLPKPILYLDIKDKGTDSLKSMKLKKGDIIVRSIDTYEDLMDELEYLENNEIKFKSVAVDHFTAFQDITMKHILTKNKKQRMTQQYYGDLGTMLKTVIQRFKDLSDKNILPYFVCQARLVQETDQDDEESYTPEIFPDLIPSVARFLTAASRVVGYSFIIDKKDKIDFALRLAPHPVYITKVTKPKEFLVPEFITNPTYKQIDDINKGLYKADSKGKKKKKKKAL